MKSFVVFVSWIIMMKVNHCNCDTDEKENRNYLGVFTVVKFSNDACQGR